MRIRSLTVAAACGAALLAAGLLPAVASGVPDPPFAQEEPVGAAELLAKVASCDQVSNGLYRTDETSAATVPVCGARGAVFWTADMDIDCDGRRTAKCNEATDPWFLPDTAFHQSDGEPLRSDALPFVVVPGVSDIWDHFAAGVEGGAVAAVIHDDRLVYAVVGDTGPRRIIGEASYAAAEALGIDPDPATGGTASGVTYILFKGSRVSPIESHEAAVALGERLAREFVQSD
ncbi:glycoside hydrolase family 75 protein [Streptomyces muensis]|uniref:Glycoside hydrolase family 75 protein n=1 Tax=Streptomyces muensis TaxID=1077944 RepID=A0A9X1PX75_STRM4|nr:glycoside hydrolase family 75 protein [Streptomyces muensis]MCF1595157.1 glycoside hydrolase family 75 protein [Streptomyces muensis]